MIRARDNPSSPPPRWRTALPFLLATALVAFVLARVDMASFAGAISRVSHVHFFALALVYTGALLTADSLASVILYRWTVAPVRFRDFFVLRGASYLPSLINHHIGQAFLTYFLSRSYGVKLARVAGATLVGYASWAACILLAGTTALALAGRPLWLALFLALGLAYLAVLHLAPAPLARWALLAPLFEVGPVGHLLAFAARVPHFLVMFFGTWASFELFGVRLPAAQAALYLPILMVVTTLPITPQGIGARDAFAALVLQPFASGAGDAERLGQIGAATLSWGIGTSLVEALFGLLLMRCAMGRWRASEPAE